MNCATSFAIEKPAIPGLGSICPMCWNSGLKMTPAKTIQCCPALQIKSDSHPVNYSAKSIHRATEWLNERFIAMNELQFDLARILSNFTATSPVKCRDLEQYFLGFTALDSESRRRKILKSIHDLKDGWQLPVGSSRKPPEGFWLISTLEDFKRQVIVDKSQPITSLSLIHKVARRNFPIFAEQLELDFFGNVEKENESI